MNIVVASSEVVPFAKTGGLADVAGALPLELAQLGHVPTVFMPAYESVMKSGYDLQDTNIDLQIPLGVKVAHGRLLKSTLPGSDIAVYFVQQDDYFGRASLYGEDGSDYPDNCERFVFYCRSVLEGIRLLGLKPDLIHANDWQTGLIPALLNIEYSGTPIYENIATLMTIHNLAYQGSFWHWDMLLTGLDWKHFNWKEMEYYGRLNLLKTGIVYADSINTVSPTYSREIQTDALGCGLQGVLQHRQNVLSGILNGIDSNWNPATDSHLVVNYDHSSWKQGKSGCKAALQQELGLPQNPEVPLIGIVGRLASQKGWDLILPVVEHWLGTMDVQWAILGTGQPEYQDALARLQQDHPGKFRAVLEFSNGVAHRIESGSDIFLMPSQYEPCGLNQMYSLAYGTIPVVRRTGGLADTVVHANQSTIANGTANGFSFDAFEVESLSIALQTAVQTYCEQPDVWEQLVNNGMKRDWTWSSSARQYERLYEQTIARKREPQYLH